MTAEIIWTVLGFALLGISAYMLVTRVVLPRFGSGWTSGKDRDRAMERAEMLLRRDDLDDDTRYELLRRLNSLRARNSARENWGGQVADRTTVAEINEICDRLDGGGSQHERDASTTR